MPADLRLSALEASSGVVLGVTRPLPFPPSVRAPLEELERAMLPALLRPPCLVSFSGGRDSSAVLAVAVQLARRESLTLPVPATIRFRTAGRSAERDWQEQVVVHLGLEDWVRVDVDGELDCVGPVSAAALRRHGLLWPPNVHFHVPLLREAAGGSLLTGVGGDEVLGGARWSRAAGVLAGAVRPEPRDTLRVALALAPGSVRRAFLRRRAPVPFPWLRPHASHRVQEALVRDAAAEPLRHAQRLAWRLGLRYVRAGTASLELLADDADALVLHPLADPGFCAALASLSRRTRHGGRRARTEALFGGLLPPEIVGRPGKAGFGQAAYGPHSRAFTARWEGAGVDPELVDSDALRRVWPQAERDGRLLTVLQAVWLATDGQASSSGEELGQTVDRRSE